MHMQGGPRMPKDASAGPRRHLDAIARRSLLLSQKAPLACARRSSTVWRCELSV